MSYTRRTVSAHHERTLMSDTEKNAEILVMKAAAELRKAAALNKKRYAELTGVADYLESIIHETELGYGDLLFPEPRADAPLSVEDEIKKMIKPFKVRLSR
jgi:hypothetical protein